MVARAGQSPLSQFDQDAIRNLLWLEEDETRILQSIVNRKGVDARLLAYAKKELAEDDVSPLQKLRPLLP